MSRFTKLIREGDLFFNSMYNILFKYLLTVWIPFRIYWISLITTMHLLQQEVISQRANIIFLGFKRTVGNPVKCKFYGFGGFILRCVVQKKSEICYFSSFQSINRKESVLLRNLKKFNFVKFLNIKIIHSIVNLEVLMVVCRYIENLFLVSLNFRIFFLIDLKFLKYISYNFKSGNFKFNNNELLFFDINFFFDLTIQISIYFIFEVLFERLLVGNTRFKFSQSPYSALKLIKQEFKGVDWVIKGNFLKCSNLINHKVFIGQVKKVIICNKTILLLKYLLRFINKTKFQILFLRDLFLDIYFLELDLFCESLSSLFNRKSSKKKNFCINSDLFRNKKYINFIFKNVYYVRYASVFIFGIIGSKSDCKIIRANLKEFGYKFLLVHFNFKDFKILHFNFTGILFLGVFIKGDLNKKKYLRIKKSTSINNLLFVSAVKLYAPIKLILSRLFNNNFLKKKKLGNFVPTACRRLINLDHVVILRFYNHKIYGILNYYWFINNSLNLITSGLKYSCALTLTLKYKFRHQSKIFKKFGKAFKNFNSNIELYIPKVIY